MANAAEDKSQAGIRITETFDFVSLPLGDQLAKIVDTLGLGNKVEDKVFLTAQNTPTANDPQPQRVLVAGTPAQIDVFRDALSAYRQAVAEGYSGAGLSHIMDDFREQARLKYSNPS